MGTLELQNLTYSYDKKKKKMENTMCYYRGDLYSYTISTSQKL